jgi:NAD(P)H-dependent FMN reductase
MYLMRAAIGDGIRLGVLKSALNFLFHEWASKPAAVVSYGAHEGSKAAEQLAQVLQGLVVDWGVGYVIDVMDGPGFNERRGFSAEREDLWRREEWNKRVGRAFQEMSKRSCAESSFTNGGQPKKP